MSKITEIVNDIRALAAEVPSFAATAESLIEGIEDGSILVIDEVSQYDENYEAFEDAEWEAEYERMTSHPSTPPWV